jgi:hypothetical protein
MEIKLPPDIEAGLAEEARRCGCSMEKLILIAVRVYLSGRDALPPPPPLQSPYKPEDFPPGSLAERLAPYIGVLDSRELGPEAQEWLPLSENTGEKFARILIRKHRERARDETIGPDDS